MNATTDEFRGRSPLPDYGRPPVIEVVCGLQFDPLPDFKAPALGLFWSRIRQEYPAASEQPELAPAIGLFGKPVVANGPRLEVTTTPPLPRMFFVNSVQNWLIQLQRDRFLHNWRKVEQDDPYPRYPNVFGKFWDAWTKFRAFCADESFGTPTVRQCEITYINHIPVGEGWHSLGDIAEVFPDLGWRTRQRFLPGPESVAWRSGFLLPESQGRLHVSIRHAVRVK
ncbi:MAG: TIGR04255 family protein, partial [Planctomycetes bacterium]|nr:TIGR04255 family protein [Planctomycetota bacterium]